MTEQLDFNSIVTGKAKKSEAEMTITISGNKSMLEKIKGMLAYLEWCGDVGHSAAGGVYVDGDGADRIHVSGVDLKPYKSMITDQVSNADIAMSAEDKMYPHRLG